MTHVSIQVTAWEKPELTRKCIDAITYNWKTFHHDMFFDIVVLDDASKQPETLLLYDELRERDIRILQKPFSCGLPDSRNLGLHYATKNPNKTDMSSPFAYVAQISNDVCVCGNWLRNLIAFLEKGYGPAGKKVVTASPVWRNYGPQPHPWSEEQTLLRWHKDASFSALDDYARDFENKWGHWDSGENDQSFFGGLVVFNPRVLLEELGWFDPRYYAFYEDNDTMQRANSRNIVCASIGKAWVHHLGGETISKPNIIGDHDGWEWERKQQVKLRTESQGRVFQWG